MAEALEELSIVALDAQGDGVAANGAIVPGALPGERARVTLDGQARGARRDAERRARARRADVPLVRPMRRLRRAAHVGVALSRVEARPRRRGAEARGRCGRGRRARRRAWRGPAPRDLSRPLSPWPRPRRSASCARGRTTSYRSTTARCSPRHGGRGSSGARAERRSERIDEAARHRRDRDARRARRRSARLGAARARGSAEARADGGCARSRARLQSRRGRDRAPAASRQVRRGAGQAAARRLPAGDRSGRNVARRVRRAGARGTQRGSRTCSAAPALSR